MGEDNIRVENRRAIAMADSSAGKFPSEPLDPLALESALKLFLPTNGNEALIIAARCQVHDLEPWAVEPNLRRNC